MFVDTHAHIFSEYYDDIDNVLKSAALKGVKYCINNGTNLNSNKEVLQLTKKYDNVYGAIGIHPEDVDNYCEDDIQFIIDNLNDSKIVALGEIGLDYHYGKENREKQIALFERQLEIAQKYNLPVIVHSRDATEDTINILKKYNVKGTIHSFSGSLELANIYIKMGFLLGINGVVTFKNCNLKNVLKDIGLENIVLETDSPYLTPEPFRGKQNNPGHILDIAVFLENIYGISKEKIAEVVKSNIKRIYNRIDLEK